MKIFLVLLFLLALAAAYSSLWMTRPVFDERLDAQVWDGIAIAPSEEALTLAMTRDGSALWVRRADAEGVYAVDLTEVFDREFDDALDAFSTVNETGLRALDAGHSESFYSWDALSLPLAPRYPNVAAGTNFREHAQEVGLDEVPFLFPKLSTATAWNNTVLPGDRLDYEVELCAVPLTDYTPGADVPLGLLLCGDYTDRWVLVKELDLDGVMGQTGFAQAKGGDTRLPLGPLLVVPNDEDFYRQVELSLYLNDALRQRSMASKMVWSPTEILDNALADCESPYQVGDETVSIADCKGIPAGTLVLTGTPGGVLFHLATLWSPWAYLREGDVVTSFGTYLGLTRNQVKAN